MPVSVEIQWTRIIQRAVPVGWRAFVTLLVEMLPPDQRVSKIVVKVDSRHDPAQITASWTNTKTDQWLHVNITGKDQLQALVEHDVVTIEIALEPKSIGFIPTGFRAKTHDYSGLGVVPGRAGAMSTLKPIF